MSDLGDRALNEEVDRQVAIEKAQAAGPLTDPTPGEARLSDDVRQRIVIALCKADGISNSLGVTDAIVGIEDLRALLTAEVSLAARLAARDATLDLASTYRLAGDEYLRHAEAAGAERDEIAGRLSDLLCDLTGGRLSKTGYSVATMRQAIEEAFEADHQAEVADLRAKVERVEALADEWEPMARVPGRPESWFGVHARLRAALGGEHA